LRSGVSSEAGATRVRATTVAKPGASYRYGTYNTGSISAWLGSFWRTSPLTPTTVSHASLRSSRTSRTRRPSAS
jgi:hypothetical protein